MTYLIQRLCVATLLSVLAACGGGGGGGSSSAPTISTDSSSPDAGQPRIGGYVNNANHSYSGDIRYTAAGEGARNLKVVSQESDDSYWEIRSLTPRLGSYRCAESDLELMLQRGNAAPLHSQGCELTVTEAGDGRISGYFTATLLDASGKVQSLQNGTFSITLAEAILDRDEDGLSDADDNCPFDANPDQADQDGNNIGDACEAADDEEFGVS